MNQEEYIEQAWNAFTDSAQYLLRVSPDLPSLISNAKEMADVLSILFDIELSIQHPQAYETYVRNREESDDEY